MDWTDDEFNSMNKAIFPKHPVVQYDPYATDPYAQ